MKLLPRFKTSTELQAQNSPLRMFFGVAGAVVAGVTVGLATKNKTAAEGAAWAALIANAACGVLTFRDRPQQDAADVADALPSPENH